MKTCLVTTTINVPTVLALYQKFNPGTALAVFDKKTPVKAAKWCEEHDIRFLTPEMQDELYPKFSELLGWNCVARRNIGYLQAAADVIVTIDDDNIPLTDDYFLHFEQMGFPFNGLQTGYGRGDWFDAASLQFPITGDPAVQRGMPQELLPPTPFFQPATDAKIGVLQGCILGDPDTSAVDRISKRPQVHLVSEIFQNGVAVAPYTFTPVNTQNTGFHKSLLPAMLLCPQFGRYDDIFASLICQRVMWPDKFHVLHGKPFVLQQRVRTDHLRDLAAEQWGAEHAAEFARLLFSMLVEKMPTIIDRVRYIHTQMSMVKWWPQGIPKLAGAWLDEVEKVL